MAIEQDIDFEGEKPRPKTQAQESADLEKVTEYTEETDLGSVNVNNLNAISLIEARRSKETQAREDELAKVDITKEDVDLIVRELEITKQQAELALRRSDGDPVRALVKLISQ